MGVNRRLDVVPEDHEFPRCDGVDFPPSEGDEVLRIRARGVIERRVLPEEPSEIDYGEGNIDLLTSRYRKSLGSAGSSRHSSGHCPRHPLPGS